MVTKTKKCTKCRKLLPLTKFSISRRKTKSGIKIYLRSACDECRREADKSYRRAYAASKEAKASNRESCRKYYEKNKKKINARNTKRYSKGPLREAYLKRMRIYYLDRKK